MSFCPPAGGSESFVYYGKLAYKSQKHNAKKKTRKFDKKFQLGNVRGFYNLHLYRAISKKKASKKIVRV